MDWRNHITTDSDTIARTEIFVPFATEDFLITLANKGLCKRAQKDLLSVEKVDVLPEGDCLKVIFPDASVTLAPNISQSVCSCPSKVVCKHILMGILVAKEVSSETSVTTGNSDTLSVAAENAFPVSAGSWQSLREVDIASLRKKAGKRLFEDTLRLIQNGWTADFKEGEMLEATINTEQVTVYFPKENSLEYAVCKCGEPGLCKHKLIAVLSFLSAQNLLGETEGDSNITVSLLTDATKELIRSAGGFVAGILDKGLISCSDNDSESAIQYSVRLETSGIGNLARMFRTLSSDLENMLSKHVAFNALTTFALLSRLHNTMRLILQNEHNTQMLSNLIESTRSDYYTTPVGTFTGLGAIPWQTRSGYFGLTAYLFYHEKQTVCTYTVSMADYYSQTEALATIDNLRKQYDKNENWAEGISMVTLSKSTFVLRNFKMNSRRRLSSSGQTHYESKSAFSLENRSLPESFTVLFEVSTETTPATYSYFSKKEQEQIVLIPFRRIEKVHFNRTEQKLYFEMVEVDDKTESPAVSEIEQTSENKQDVSNSFAAFLEFNDFTLPAIKKLEKMAQYPDNQFRYMVCRKLKGGFTPVSMIEHKGVNNFFFNEII
ncbi:MAG: hypothetical protein LBV74_20705 [Tannerella sp.]|jgi:hypothetical protein|nr:hypothetical protein [Tannerella sp.]